MAIAFPLPHKATGFHRKSAPTRNRAGQLVLADEYEAEPYTVNKCLFYEYMGGKVTAAKEDYDQTAAFYCAPNSEVTEGDKIENITGKNGVIEPGPFEVLKVTKVTDLGGNIHHLSCKIRGSSG